MCLLRSRASAKTSLGQFSNCPKLIRGSRNLKEWMRERSRLVVTNGCFDLLHAGHIKLLRRAAAQGDWLLVLLNSDRSVRELKGPTRPLNREMDRALVLDELDCVDGIFIFDEKRATRWFKFIKPYVWVKGGDYTIESLDQDEVKAVQAGGGKVCILPLLDNLSTTKILSGM